MPNNYDRYDREPSRSRLYESLEGSPEDRTDRGRERDYSPRRPYPDRDPFSERTSRPMEEPSVDPMSASNGGVTITGNTFIVRNDRDISAIGRAINEEAERVRRSRL